MVWQEYIVAAVVLFIILFLYKEWLATSMVFFIAVVVLITTDVISAGEALQGFANEQLAIIALLLILSNVLRKSSTIDTYFRKILKSSDSPRRFMAKLTGTVGISSAFFNNTPLVAMMMPFVYSWTRENNYSPSKFLIPLSFASILGGCITLIGTSTNLIVNGLAMEAGVESLSLFDFTPVGLVMFVIGSLFIFLFSQKMLPDNKKLFNTENGNSRQYFFETIVENGAPVIGKSVQEAGLRNLKGLFLVELVREDTPIRPVSSKEVLQEGDLLFFAGDVGAIADLDVSSLGLSLPQSCQGIPGSETDMAEVVISHNSVLNGQYIKDTDFRGRYDGAILAIHRNGERVWGQLGNIKLNAGDVLLVMKGQDFNKRTENNPAFYIISNYKKDEEVDFKKVLVIFLGMITAIVLTAFQVVSLINSLLLLLVLSLVSGVANPRDIRRSIDFDLLLIIGLGLALGKAMINSGTAEHLAELLLTLSKGLNPIVFLIILFSFTNVLASIITSKAAVAVTLPVSLQVAAALEIHPHPFVLVIAFAGAANFLTPIGYQTNLMVFGPGGYSFRDFFKIGLPITLLYLIFTVIILAWTYDL